MDNETGASTFMILRMLGPITVLGPFLIWLTVMGPMLLYPIARWRAHREPVVDPQLGLKVVLHTFGVIALQLALAATTLLLYAILSKMPSDDKGGLYRFAFGLLVPSGIVLGTMLQLIKRTNEPVFPGVKRLFLGYNLIVTGLFGFIAFVAAFEALFAKGSTDDFGRIAAAAVVVYGAACVACGVQFGRLVLAGYTSPMVPPPDVMSPPAPQPPAPPAGPSLPSLGGGSFPPIDPK